MFSTVTGCGHQKRASSIAPAATGTVGTYLEEIKSLLKNTRQPTLKLNSPKRRRVEPDMTAEAMKRVEGTLKITEPSSTQSNQPPKNRRPESDTPPKAANEATQTIGEVKAPSMQLHPSPKQTDLVSEIATETANEVTYTTNTAGSSSNQPYPISILSMSADFIGQSTTSLESPVPSPSNMTIDAKKQSKTILWIFIPSSTDVVPLRLRSCMTMRSLFDSVFKIWGLAEQQQQDTVLGLRTSLRNNVIEKNLMLMREFEDTFEAFIQIIDGLRCWEQEDGCCSVTIEAVLA